MTPYMLEMLSMDLHHKAEGGTPKVNLYYHEAERRATGAVALTFSSGPICENQQESRPRTATTYVIDGAIARHFDGRQHAQRFLSGIVKNAEFVSHAYWHSRLWC